MKKRAVAFILTILLLFLALFAQIFVIAEADHDCSGEDCVICEIITILSGTIKCSWIAALLIVGAILFGVEKSLFVREERESASSLVTLKVKLSN